MTLLVPRGYYHRDNGGGPPPGPKLFDVQTYTGNASARVFDFEMDLLTEGGLLWVKRLDGVTATAAWDTERGMTSTSSPFFTFNSTAIASEPGTNGAEATVDGFQFVGSPSSASYNGNTFSYVALVMLMAAGFLDIVRYTGTGVARTVAHSLGSVPGMIIIKREDVGGSSGVFSTYHVSAGATNVLVVNASSSASTSDRWDDTTPTSTEFYLKTHAAVNQSAGSYVAYVFAESGPNIKCGSYVGNGSATGPSVSLGWAPDFILIKSVTSSVGWYVYDSGRNGANPWINKFQLGAGVLEDTVGEDIDVTSGGFQIMTSGIHNSSGQTYAYMAIRKQA